MEKIKLAVFHYHYLPGGISTVVKLSLKSLLQNYPGIEKISLISGRNSNVSNLAADIQSFFPDTDIDYETVPEIDYLHESDTFDNDSIQKIKNTLKKYRGYIYWIHNHHLGKNPWFTKVITDFASSEKNEKFLFHIHDFPECSRYENYIYLNKIADRPYPSGSNIRYAVLNSRDYSFMKKAGIDESSLFLLPNPVLQQGIIKGKPSETEKKKLKDELLKKGKGLFSFNPDKPTAVYPVRTIRRKNVFEAALISLLTSGGMNLILTLPGISDQEIRYSDTISEYYKNGIIKGLWGTGIQGSPVETDLFSILDICDLVISSSVMEGFGYIFTDTISWGKPIVSRHLETSEDFKPLFSSDQSCFYKNFNIPLNLKMKESLEKSYRNYINSMGKKYITSLNPDSFSEHLLTGETIDFSYLPYEMQGEFLKKAASSSNLKSEIRELNSSLISMSERLIKAEPKTECRDISEYYGADIFSHNFFKIINSFENHNFTESDYSAVSEKLFSMFTTPDSLRLLTGRL
jgi:glycosyltransferase involved in cell wall biosynthesis